MQNLTNQLVQQADAFIEALNIESESSYKELKQITQFSKTLSKQFSIFSNQLKEVSTMFFKQINNNQENYFKTDLTYLKDVIEESTSLLCQISTDINEVVTVPVNLFIPGFSSIYKDIKSKAIKLKQDVCLVFEPSQRKSDSNNYLGYNGVLMTRKRQQKVDLSDVQSKYSELMKQLQVLHSNKYRALRSAYQHLTTVLNQISHLKMNQSEQNIYHPHQISRQLVKQIDKQCGGVILLKLIPTDPSHDHLLPSELIEAKIKNEMQFMLGLSSSTDPNIKSLILEDIENIKLLLNNLNCLVERQINITPAKYYQLSIMLRHAFKLILVQKQKQQLLHILLLISLRIHSQGKQIIRQLSKDEDYWIKKQNWQALLSHLKRQISIQKQSKVESPTKEKRLSKSRNLLSRSFKNLWSYQQDSIKEHDFSLSLEILKELNIFIMRLQIPNNLAIKITIGLCQKQKIPQYQIQKILKQQKQYNKQKLNKKYSSSINTKLRKQKKMMNPQFNKVFKAIKYSLQFLDIQDYSQLIVINKYYSNKLLKPIYKRLLLFQSPSIVSQKRSQIYKQILNSQKYSEQKYVNMIKQIPKNIQISQVIDQDVRRCLKWAPQLQPQLYQILTCYSYFHPEVRYTQGMHCICEHLFHFELSQAQIYSMFENLMSIHMKDIFNLNFEKLRLKMYQYTRFLELNSPKLSQHFIKQSIQTQHYIIQWALTLWGDKQGALVDILWDGFILSGWKWWIKTCIWIVSLFEKQLLLLNFDSILKHLNTEIQVITLNKSIHQLEELSNKSMSICSQIYNIGVPNSLQKDMELQYQYSDHKLLPILQLQNNNK